MNKTKMYIVIICLVFLAGMFFSAFVFRPPEKDEYYRIGYIYDERSGNKIPMFSENIISYNWTDIGFTRIHLVIPCETCENRTTIVYYLTK